MDVPFFGLAANGSYTPGERDCWKEGFRGASTGVTGTFDAVDAEDVDVDVEVTVRIRATSAGRVVDEGD